MVGKDNPEDQANDHPEYHKSPNCVPVRTVKQSPFCKHSISSSPVIVEATNQLQPTQHRVGSSEAGSLVATARENSLGTCEMSISIKEEEGQVR